MSEFNVNTCCQLDGGVYGVLSCCVMWLTEGRPQPQQGGGGAASWMGVGGRLAD